MKVIRQGDVYLRQVDSVPRDAQRRPEGALQVPGENGHNHQLTAPGLELYERPNGQAVAVLPEVGTLEHDEHPAADVGKGVWVVTTSQAHDWPTTPELQAEREPPQPTQEQRPAQPSQPQPSRPRTRPHRD